MPIYMGESQKTLFKGDYLPAEFYKGGKKVTGYENVTLSGTEVSAENTYRDEVSIIVKGRGRQDSGVTGTNVALNADFAEGTKYWTLWEADMSVQGDVMTVLASAQGGGAIQYLMEPEKFVGHMLYSCVWFQTDDPECYFVFLNDGYEQATVKAPETGKFVFLSAVRTIHSDPKWLFIKAQDYRTEGWTSCQFRRPMVLDLTAIFGAGNEPSKEQMDKMMQQEANWFTGSGKLPQAPTPGYPQTPLFSEGKVWSEGRNVFCNHFDSYTRPKDYRILPINLPQGTYYFSAERIGHIVTDITIAVVKFGESYSDFKNDIRIVVDNTGTIVPQMIKIDSTWTSPKLAVYCKTEDLWNELFTNYHVQLEKGMKATPYQPYRSPASIDLPVLRAIPDGNGGFSARDSLTSVEGMPGWYDLRREVCERQITHLNKNDERVNSFCYYFLIPDGEKGVKMCSHFRFTFLNGDEPGLFTDRDFLPAKALFFCMEGIVSKDNSEMTDSAEANAWLQAQSDAGTPLTVWYPLETPTTERVYLGEMGAYPYYTRIYDDCTVKTDKDVTLNIIGGQS